MEVPRGVGKFVNVLVCLVAIAGIGWSGMVLFQVWQSRQQINAACAGLVPAGRVLALSQADGTITNRNDENYAIKLQAGMPQQCAINVDRRWFFTATMGVLPSDESLETDDTFDTVVNRYRPTYPGRLQVPEG